MDASEGAPCHCPCADHTLLRLRLRLRNDFTALQPIPDLAKDLYIIAVIVSAASSSRAESGVEVGGRTISASLRGISVQLVV